MANCQAGPESSARGRHVRSQSSHRRRHRPGHAAGLLHAPPGAQHRSTARLFRPQRDRDGRCTGSTRSARECVDRRVSAAIAATRAPQGAERVVLMVKIDRVGFGEGARRRLAQANFTVTAVSVETGEPVAKGAFRVNSPTDDPRWARQALAEEITARIRFAFSLNTPRVRKSLPPRTISTRLASDPAPVITPNAPAATPRAAAVAPQPTAQKPVVVAAPPKPAPPTPQEMAAPPVAETPTIRPHPRTACTTRCRYRQGYTGRTGCRRHDPASA